MSIDTEIVARAIQLPALPPVAAQILRLKKDEGSSMRDLKRVIDRDPPLAANVLRVANSAMFGAQRKYTDLHDAIIYIGFNNVQSLAIGMAAIKVFRGGRTMAPYFRKDFTTHSFCTAAVCNHLARGARGILPGTAFVVGLLHDIGKLVIEIAGRDNWNTVLFEVKKSQTTLDAEKKVLGSTHARLGAKLLKTWGLPEEIVAAVQYHHQAGLCPAAAKPYASICQVADTIVLEEKPTPAINPKPKPADEATWRVFRFEPMRLKAECRDVMSCALRDLAAFL
ncbi:MAG: HDOD domain-containing protein [Planctomycetota bacterium]|jgi:putative nucleotidyltransferase with HDIG domain